MLSKFILIHPDWPAPNNVRAISTTRTGGVSDAPFDSLNLSDRVDDDPEAVAANREHLLARSDLPGQPRWLRQTHGNRVADLDQASGTPEADAGISRTSRMVCAVLTADCLPVLFCDANGDIVAAAHAGWRGLAGGVLEATVAAMRCEPADILVWLGPAIGADVFVVGDEVREVFVDQHSQCETAFRASQSGRWLADLYVLARLRLGAMGIEKVFGGDHCTYSEPERFFSYRRDGKCGRMATLIWSE